MLHVHSKIEMDMTCDKFFKIRTTMCPIRVSDMFQTRYNFMIECPCYIGHA